MRLEIIIMSVVNLIILVLLEAFTLSVAWFFGAVTGEVINYTLVGIVTFVIWSLWTVLIVVSQIESRRDDE